MAHEWIGTDRMTYSRIAGDASGAALHRCLVRCVRCGVLAVIGEWRAPPCKQVKP